MDFLIANLATILISGLLLALVLWIVASMVKKKKNGKAVGCHCGCGSCVNTSFCQKPQEDLKHIDQTDN